LSATLSILNDALEQLLVERRDALISAMRSDSEISVEMASWAIERAQAQLSVAALGRYAQRAKAELVGQDVLLSLARSVAVAPIRSIVAALLREPQSLSVRTPRTQVAVTNLLVETLRHAGESRVQTQCDKQFAGFHRVIAFGQTETIAQIADQCSPGCVVESYGNGVGVQVIDQCVGPAVARQLAWDWTAFDGGGCLSPVIAWVVGSSRNQKTQLLDEVADAMRAIDRQFAREMTDASWLAHERSWRAGCAAQAVRSVVERDWSAHWVELDDTGEILPSLLSIGGRNIVLCAATQNQLLAWLSANAPLISNIGTVPCANSDLELLGLPVVLLGSMQDPAFDGEADRRPARVIHVASRVTEP
jgi:hypothetical protein